MKRSIIITFSEIALKGRNRNYFYDLINQTVIRRAKEQNLDIKMLQRGSRVFFFFDLWTNEKELILLDILKNIIGLGWISLGYVFSSYLEEDFKEVVDKLIEYIQPKTYRISAKNSYKGDFESSDELMFFFAKYINEKHNLKVDLENYDFNLEIRIENKNFSFISTKIIKGLEGLPPGSMGNGLVLLSGGIDSPVASFMMQSRGMNNHFITFLTPSTSGEDTTSKIKKLAAKLNKFNTVSTKLFMVNIKPLQNHLQEFAFENYRTVILRRAFIKFSEQIANQYNLRAFIGGDSLGQVSSQTLEAQEVIEQASNLLYFKPLIGMNKNQIIEIAKKIGTYETSIQPGSDTCSYYAPSNPIIHPILEKTLKQEAKMKLYDRLIQILMKTEMEIVDL